MNAPTWLAGSKTRIDLTLALTRVLSPGERILLGTLSMVRLTARPIPALDISKTRRTILLLLGEKAGMRESVRHSLFRHASDFIPLTDLAIFNATGLADLSRRNEVKAEIRLGAVGSDLSHRNQMETDEGGCSRKLQ